MEWFVTAARLVELHAVAQIVGSRWAEAASRVFAARARATYALFMLEAGMAKIAQYLAALVGLAMLAGPVKAQAQFPAKPVRIVVPYSAGGGLDAGVRVIAQKLGDDWKQPVIVDNRPGASGAIGAQAVAGSPADGYVLLAASPGETVLAPILNPRATFDPARELRPISLVATLPIALVAQASLPANTLDELKALANAKPGAFHYGTIGIGSSQHFAGELVKLQAGMSLGVVNYQGMAQAITELLGGHIQLVVTGSAACTALRELRCSRLMFVSAVSCAR